MLRLIKPEISQQPELEVLTPLVSIRQQHVRIVRKVSMKTSWGGEEIKTLTPEEYQVLCECVALKLITINDDGKFVLAGMANQFLANNNEKTVYHFYDPATESVLEIGLYEILVMQTYTFDEEGMSGVSNEQERVALELLETIGFVQTRKGTKGLDFFVTEAGIRFLIHEGFLLG